MELDYKGRMFSFSKQKRKKKNRKITLFSLLIIIATIIILILSSIDQKKIKNIESLLLRNKLENSEKLFRKIRGSIFHRNAKTELSALIKLYKGKNKEGKQILDRIDSDRSYLDFRSFLGFFSDNARYHELECYSEFLQRIYGEDPSLNLFSATALTALFFPEKSEEMIKPAEKSLTDSIKKKVKKIKELNAMVKTGKVNFVFDSNKEPVAFYDIGGEKTVPLIKGFNFSKFGKIFKKGIQFFTITIDSRLQQKIDLLFSGKHGSFILIDLDDGSIISAYSKPFDKSFENSVFSEEFEPGSTIKCLTLFSYLNSKAEDIFPFECRGFTVIDGKILYDWIKHGRINNSVEALSRSCNLVFSKMGLLTGREKLFEFLNKFYFNTPPLKDLFLRFNMGTFNNKIADNYSLANLSIGLNEIKETTFHIALTSSLFAMDGASPSPFLIMNRKNILGLGNYYHKSSTIEILKSNSAYNTIRIAMNSVVEDSKGTGRRARSKIVKLAIKTGTAGKKKLGFDSVISGFFPYDAPRYAFALRLERAGKAELAGARFVKEFIKIFYKNR